MAKSVILDKYLAQGTTYKTHEREAWIIQYIGTDSSSAGKLVIDNKPTGNIVTTVAPLRQVATNLLGPLNLGDLYYVVPSETEIYWDGASGSVCRVLGTKIILEPGETLGEPYITRFKRQNYEYITYVEDSYSHGTNTTWTADDENEVYSLTPSTIERYVFDGPVMVDVSNLSTTLDENNFYIRFYLDNLPLENIYGTNIYGGVDVMSMPRPPNTTDGMVPFTLKETPIEVLGDHTLSIRAINVSGGDLTPATDTSITITVTAIVKYFKQIS